MCAVKFGNALFGFIEIIFLLKINKNLVANISTGGDSGKIIGQCGGRTHDIRVISTTL